MDSFLGCCFTLSKVEKNTKYPTNIKWMNNWRYDHVIELSSTMKMDNPSYMQERERANLIWIRSGQTRRMLNGSMYIKLKQANLNHDKIKIT